MFCWWTFCLTGKSDFENAADRAQKEKVEALTDPLSFFN